MQSQEDVFRHDVVQVHRKQQRDRHNRDRHPPEYRGGSFGKNLAAFTLLGHAAWHTTDAKDVCVDCWKPTPSAPRSSGCWPGNLNAGKSAQTGYHRYLVPWSDGHNDEQRANTRTRIHRLRS